MPFGNILFQHLECGETKDIQSFPKHCMMSEIKRVKQLRQHSKHQDLSADKLSHTEPFLSFTSVGLRDTSLYIRSRVEKEGQRQDKMFKNRKSKRRVVI